MTRSEVLLAEHKPRHCFGDVKVFKEHGGHDYVTGTYVEINEESCGIDLLLSGPVCTQLSRLNGQRKDAAGCYDAQEEEIAGVSGETYHFGFKKVRG
jgi:hypothetical protein